MARARGESGTRCSRPALIRVAGTVQTLASVSISLQRAPSASPDRAAVRIANSNAWAAKPSPKVGTRPAALHASIGFFVGVQSAG
jgi:hypothetical protein